MPSQMVSLKILKRSKKSRARLGILKTPHGEVRTPTLVGVATQATVKALTVDQVKATGTGILISNTFHLHLKPGEKVIKAAGKIHKFMHWKAPLMTDSGGYQVFSLGFGKDFGVGKIASAPSKHKVGLKQQPKLLKITEEGVTFTSYLDGSKILLTPEKSMQIQADIGADIAFAFDECTPPLADRAYSEQSMERTHRWAERCLKARDPKQAVYGIVQGSKFPDLRVLSAKTIAAMPFDGFGIGGEFGYDKKTMSKMLRLVIDELPDDKPRHLLGVGHPDDILRVIKEGVDTFDCTVPTQYARHGTAFVTGGRVEITKAKYLNDKKPLDPKCSCVTCKTYSRAYLCHLLRAKETLGGTLVTIHNLSYFQNMIAGIRRDIQKGLV